MFIEATDYFGFKSSAIIEKDYYVSQLIALFAKLENENFRLVFSGGTCLAKAHRLTQRMSEDIDFKVQSKTAISRSQYKMKFKHFRNEILNTLKKSDFILGEHKTRNEGKYFGININYPSSAIHQLHDTLRPNILLEFAHSTIRLPVQQLSVSPLLQEALGETILFPTSNPYCSSVLETAAEKWVGLTRRLAGCRQQL